MEASCQESNKSSWWSVLGPELIHIRVVLHQFVIGLEMSFLNAALIFGTFGPLFLESVGKFVQRPTTFCCLSFGTSQKINQRQSLLKQHTVKQHGTGIRRPGASKHQSYTALAELQIQISSSFPVLTTRLGRQCLLKPLGAKGWFFEIFVPRALLRC